ncbi:MAG: hypothetical protein WCF11_04445, partial [Azonexus sp.]
VGHGALYKSEFAYFTWSTAIFAATKKRPCRQQCCNISEILNENSGMQISCPLHTRLLACQESER